MRELLLIAWLGAWLGFSGCADRAPREQALAPTPRGFVVFSAASLVIDRLEVPVSPPVAVGSEPSATTTASDAPEVVSVAPDGALIAHRNGRAIVRAAGTGSALAVEVRAVNALRLAPVSLLLCPRCQARLRLETENGEEIPAQAARWASDAPGVAIVIEGTVEAGLPGVATVTGSYGGVEARARVVVREPGRVGRPAAAR